MIRGDTANASAFSIGGRAPCIAALVILLFSLTPAPASSSGEDALQRKALGQLSNFTDWLVANNERGFIGGVGWPDEVKGDAADWNRLADAWYTAADKAGLWVTAWATGEWWGTLYPLAAYEDRMPGVGVDSINTQAAIVGAHSTFGTVMRGVNVAGGEFAAPAVDRTSSFSNANVGVYDRAYHYDSKGTFAYLAARGVKLVRIPFRWERLQPKLGEAVHAAEVQRLKDVVARAHSVGLKIILDMHNYGGYYLYDGTQGVRRPIGSPEIPTWRFAEIWGRISNNFKNNPAVIGYGLMNEPVDLAATKKLSPAQVWFKASQDAVARIRIHGDKKLVLVAGYNWSGAQAWQQNNPVPWIKDPANSYRYEAHHYFDADNSGTYQRTYAQELELARLQGF